MTSHSCTFALACLASACTSYVSIKPTELPKLNEGSVGVVASGPDRGQAIAVSVANVEQPDGTLTQIEGTFDLRITTRSGKETVVEEPVASIIDGPNLRVQGGNIPETTFALEDVQETEVSQLSLGKTAALSFLLPMGAAALALLLFL